MNIFDKIFGSWKDYDENIKINYGVVHDPGSHNPLIILTHEYKDIWRDVKASKNLYEAFMYIFGEPGWSPDGTTLTVKQLQRQSVMENEKVSRKKHGTDNSEVYNSKNEITTSPVRA